MEFGLSLFTSDRGIKPHEAAAAAESAGFTTFYVPEHSHIPANRGTDHPETGDSSLPDDRYMRTLDPWVSLAMAAAVTSTIRLGTAVALPLQSDPITLAKTVASLDHLSGGRVDFGIGFGWNLEEMADHVVFMDQGRVTDEASVRSLSSRSRPWRIQSLDGARLARACEELGVIVQSTVTADSTASGHAEALVELPDEQMAARLLGDLARADAAVIGFGPAAGRLESAYLQSDAARRQGAL